MKTRQQKVSDQYNAGRAYGILRHTLENEGTDIEGALWVGPLISILAEKFKESGIPFEYFEQEMLNAIEYYKY